MTTASDTLAAAVMARAGTPVLRELTNPGDASATAIDAARLAGACTGACA
jgi:hypothetical protein